MTMLDELHTMGSGEVLNTLLTLLYIQFDINPNTVSSDVTLRDLDLSSLDQISFFTDVEDEFTKVSAGVHFSDLEVVELGKRSINEIAARVYDQLENPYTYTK